MTTALQSNSTSAELSRQLADLGLFTSDELAQWMSDHGCQATDPADKLLTSLRHANKMTVFQSELAKQGRFSEMLVGNYEVLARLGAGGMGTVFKARHRRMKRIVALKVIAKNLCKDQTAVQRFQREVETIARLHHPNIVLAHDADEAEIGHFLVMEFVDGRDLSSLVQETGPLSIRDAVSCTIQTAQGLEYAHAQSIVHRDIKPANLLRDAMGMVKITDLGLARLNQSAQESVDTGLTQSGCVVGTPDFMSTEQAVDSGSTDHRTDIYSLGCTMYYLLTGKTPYQGNTVMATLLKHRDAPIPSIRAERPETPPEIDAIFRKMVAKNPAERYPSMGEVVRALLAVPLPESVAMAPPPTPAAGHADSAKIAADQTVMLPSTANVEPATGELPALLTALLVESSRTQAGLIRQYLQSLGFNAVVAATIDEAVALAKKQKPDVVLSAMYHKDGTATELSQRLAFALPFEQPPFMLIAGQDESKHLGSLSQFGLATLLMKPFTLEKLAETLSALIHKPLTPSAPSPLASRALRPAADRSTLKVLVVDDSAVARTHEKMVLRKLGITQISEVMDGAQAVAAVGQQQFDLIVTDYNMPWMDGAALIGFLRQNAATANIPIIMVTTETDAKKLEAIHKLGVAAIVSKTFPLEVVRTLLDKQFP